MKNLLAPEAAIVERLTDRLAGVPVKRGADLAALPATHKPQRNTVFILFGGGSAAVGASEVSRLSVRWIAVVIVRNVADVRGGGQARDEAGPLAAQVIESLQGWKPCGGWSKLLMTAIDPAAFSGEYLVLPLTFTTTSAI